MEPYEILPRAQALPHPFHFLLRKGLLPNRLKFTENVSAIEDDLGLFSLFPKRPHDAQYRIFIPVLGRTRPVSSLELSRWRDGAATRGD